MTIRDRVVAEAREWLRTPYRHLAAVKGAGCDCVGLLAGVYGAAGLVMNFEMPFYAPQWHLHQKGRQLLLDELAKYAEEVTDPRPADVAVFWFGHAYSHTAIVIDWPVCLHASLASQVVELIDAQRDLHLKRCQRKYFRPKAILEADLIVHQ